MVEMFVFFFFGLLFQVPILHSHPLVLGTGLLTVSVFMACLLTFYGPLFSFSVFMVMVAGVLVVFSYTISLVPFKGATEMRDPVKSAPGSFSGKNVNKSFGVKRSVLVYKLGSKEDVWLSYLAVFMIFLFSLVVTCYQGVNGEDVWSVFINYSDVGYFSEDYSFVLVWLGVLLFVAMIFSMGVANCYEGALIQ
uniref:NADH dehydrogenase subunit 6 n=1 Tax=Saxidomus purpurata TaxID=311201 RepID=A0A0D4CGD0_9BIVA|nr:NADH dehydrogenase subunit 6 [Saxidomus purpurata]AJT47995.1 NADH dehydrogenase subunit 6 [Saxidomus purpurata]